MWIAFVACIIAVVIFIVITAVTRIAFPKNVSTGSKEEIYSQNMKKL